MRRAPGDRRPGTLLVAAGGDAGRRDGSVGAAARGAGQTPQAVSGLPNGQSWAVGLMPGGGGVGYTVTWTEPNGEQVALSLLGEDIPDANKQSVATVAQQVASELGG